MSQVKIRAQSCKSCCYCVTFCPKHVLEIGRQINEKGYPVAYAARPGDCVGCAVCGLMCPDAAIEVYR